MLKSIFRKCRAPENARRILKIMTIKDFGARVVSVWEGLRPLTRRMLVGAIERANPSNALAPKQKFSYDAHTDWELSRLLSALDEQATEAEVRKDAEKLSEIRQLAEACVEVLESQTESAEVFILLAERALARQDYRKIDVLADTLLKRFSVAEICEIARQAQHPAVRAVAHETLALAPPQALVAMLGDSLFYDIARGALEQQAFEFESEEARRLLDHLDLEEEFDGE
jgi:hypothetical protein